MKTAKKIVKTLYVKCPRCGEIGGGHKQVDDPRAGNSHMLTKMQCPLDPLNRESKPEPEQKPIGKLVDKLSRYRS